MVGRAARGVKALTLQEGDEVIGMTVCREGGQLLTVTETGYGRRSELSDYRIQSRGGKGLTNYHTEEFGDVAAIKVVDENDDIMVISSDGIVIRTRVSEVRLCRRPAKGVRVMKVEDGSHVVALVRASAETAEEETNTGEIEGSSEAGGEAPVAGDSGCGAGALRRGIRGAGNRRSVVTFFKPRTGAGREISLPLLQGTQRQRQK